MRILEENPHLDQLQQQPGLLVETSRRPVFELHAQRETTRSEHFLDLVERLATEVRRLQQLVFRALDQVADVVDVLGLQAVRRTNRQFEIIDRTQQDRIDLRCARRCFCGRFRAFQRREHRQLVTRMRAD